MAINFLPHRHRSRVLLSAIGLALLLAGCGGASDESGGSVAEQSQEDVVRNQNELRTTVEETVVFTTCELNASTGLVDIEVELPNPTDEEWEIASIESITIGVTVNDPDGFFLADADVVFATMAPGETATASASTTEFPDGGVVGECVVFDVVIPRLLGGA